MFIMARKSCVPSPFGCDQASQSFRILVLQASSFAPAFSFHDILIAVWTIIKRLAQARLLHSWMTPIPTLMITL
jgi:hypothetical protein